MADFIETLVGAPRVRLDWDKFPDSSLLRLPADSPARSEAPLPQSVADSWALGCMGRSPVTCKAVLRKANDRLAYMLLLLASLLCPAWPGLHAAMHAHDARHAAEAEAGLHHSHDIGWEGAAHHAVEASPVHVPHAHAHPDLCLIFGSRSPAPSDLVTLPVSLATVVVMSAKPLPLRDEGNPARASPDLGPPEQPRAPPAV